MRAGPPRSAAQHARGRAAADQRFRRQRPRRRSRDVAHQADAVGVVASRPSASKRRVLAACASSARGVKVLASCRQASNLKGTVTLQPLPPRPRSGADVTLEIVHGHSRRPYSSVWPVWAAKAHGWWATAVLDRDCPPRHRSGVMDWAGRLSVVARGPSSRVKRKREGDHQDLGRPALASRR